MADRWMEERDRRMRERDWRRSEQYGRGRRVDPSEMGGADREGEDRTWRRREKDDYNAPRGYGDYDYGERRYPREQGAPSQQGGGVGVAPEDFGRSESPDGPPQGYSSQTRDGSRYGGQRGRAESRYDTRDYDYVTGGYEADYWPAAYGDVPPRSSRQDGRAYGRRQDRGDDRRDPGDRAQDFLHRAGERVASWFAGGEYRRDEGRGHRGRGPQGYKRSDDRINEEAHERLTEDAWIDASGITLAVADGEVTMSGTVPDRESKHRAERIVEDILGVSHVQNNLRVARGGFGSASGYGESTAETQLRTDGGKPTSPEA